MDGMTLSLKIITYLKVGYLLHIITIFETLLLVLLFTHAPYRAWLDHMHVLPATIIVLFFLSFPFFPQLDARSRFQNYKMVRDQFYLYGFHSRIINPFAHSRCQRDAIRVAAAHFGYLSLCNKYFYKQGYRWYHILPDFVFTKPVYLLHKKFWQTTFFAKQYTCRIDYKTICLKQHKLNKVKLHLTV
jgi:hypothetical protein